jgi:DNA-binding transcriptional ArsR family regulator
VADDKPEEETRAYKSTLIYTSLKHPIRRKILRMLRSKPLTFSEILEAVGIDSGHLNYHLENLGALITHSEDGKYQLSGVGWAAVRLMGGVEEHSLELSKRKLKPTRIFARAYPLILSGALIIASLYFISYTATVRNVTNGVSWTGVLPNVNVTVANLTTGINQTVIVLSPVNVRFFSAPETINESIMSLPCQATPINLTTSWGQLEKPYFCYGIAGLIIGLVYPAVVLIEPLGNLRHKPKPRKRLKRS